MIKILVIEDDKEINDMLSSYLRENSYEVVSVFQGMAARSLMKQCEQDLIIMDLMLPYKSGDELIREFRTYSDIPIIVISAKSMTQTKIEILRLGADDYMTKPFDLDELLVRIEIIFRRNQKGIDMVVPRYITFKDIVMYLDHKQVTIANKEIILTAKEYAILELLMENPQKTFSKANLYESVWKEPYFQEDNTLNVHMSNLRNKLNKCYEGTEYISTVWGIGYRLAKD